MVAILKHQISRISLKGEEKTDFEKNGCEIQFIFLRRKE